MEPLPLALPELLLPGLLGDVEDELPPVAALPLFLVVSELEPAPALSRLQAAMPTASTKAVTAAVNAFILHLLWKGNGYYPLKGAREMPGRRSENRESLGGGPFRALPLVFLEEALT